MTLDLDQIRRYGRQILLEPIGGRGQRALLRGTVELSLDDDGDRAAALVAAIYLAGAGVGTLVLRATGLVRAQDARWLLAADDVGQDLATAVARRLAALTPDVEVRRAAAWEAAPDRVRVTIPAAAELAAAFAIRAPGSDAAEAPSEAALALWRGGVAATAAIAALLERGS